MSKPLRPRQGNVPGQRDSNVWLQAVLHLYPDALTRTYTVPPVHFNRVPYRAATVASQAVLVHKELSTDIRCRGDDADDNRIASRATSGWGGRGEARRWRHVDVQCLPIRVGRGRQTQAAAQRLGPGTGPHPHSPPQIQDQLRFHCPLQQQQQQIPLYRRQCQKQQAANQPPSPSPQFQYQYYQHNRNHRPGDQPEHRHLQQPQQEQRQPCHQHHRPFHPQKPPEYQNPHQQPLQSHHFHEYGVQKQDYQQQQQEISGHSSVDLADQLNGLSLIQSPPERGVQIQRPLWSSLQMPDGYPKAVYDSDFRDDTAQQHVLFSLQCLGEQLREVMVILSQLRFADYLCRPCYAATASHVFPRPADLGKEYRSGEFDLLLIHRRYGILIGEIKSVGVQQPGFRQTQAQRHADVVKRVQQCVKQLDRSEVVVRHLVKDIIGLQLTVRKTMFLPYVSRNHLRAVLTLEADLSKQVCRSLGAADTEEALDLCFCSDMLLEPIMVTCNMSPSSNMSPSNNMSKLCKWWGTRMSPTNTQLNDTLYLEILSRFVGPASSKSVHCVFSPPREIKTDWQAISELGGRLVTLVLTQQQIELLNRAPAKVCITGPPGTGKSIALVLMGLTWLLHGHDVHVVSVFYKSFAASQLIRHQLVKSLEASVQERWVPAGRAFFHQYDFFWGADTDVRLAARELLAASADSASGPQLHVLLDEAWFGYQGLGPRYQGLLDSLLTSLGSGLHVWAADMGNIDIPTQLDQAVFTVPLRYCSVVLREVEEGISHYSTVASYTDCGLPAPSDGPNVIRLVHYRNGHEGHDGRWPVQCWQCGLQVADLLCRRLAVGRQDPVSPNSPPPLQYRDVFILTRSSELQDDVIDVNGDVTSQACRFVQGLRQAGVPVCVLNGTFHDELQWEQDLADVSVGASDRLTVATLGAVNGLERKVVVWLPGRKESGDDCYTDEAIEALDRLASVSRCTTQLVIVHLVDGSRDVTKASRAESVPRAQCPVT